MSKKLKKSNTEFANIDTNPELNKDMIESKMEEKEIPGAGKEDVVDNEDLIIENDERYLNEYSDQ